jgi:site-specific DNA recombinase
MAGVNERLTVNERLIRCAIYTRKSTEEGLEQSFNTLQAQREAAEAYILSRKPEGWHHVPTRYDDGGWSGASLERPALTRLLADVEARRIECVVVYKVDRLSRSLLDFTRLLSLFERRGVSFVSVTQDFNTSSSMGRLTLHILLSFAQFEREIIGERTRDKLSAARRKGKWIGGVPVLGYDVAPEGGRLVVNAVEAERVREIFALCARSSSLTEALQEARARGWTAKQWTSRSGRTHGGQLLSLSTLRLLVSNVLYRGDIAHKGVVYPGEHPALVSRELWEEVSAQHPRSRTKIRCHSAVETPLNGLVRCGQCGALLTTSFTQRQGQRHLYYVCRAGKKQQPICPQHPVRSRDLEQALREHLERRGTASGLEFERLVRAVSYHSGTRYVGAELQDAVRLQFYLPVPVRPGVRRKGEEAQSPGRTPRISRLLALAIHLEGLVSEGAVRNYRELAEAGHVSRARLSQILQLNHLAPEIQEQLLFLPPTRAGFDPLREEQVRSWARVVDWQQQKQLFRAVQD